MCGRQACTLGPDHVSKACQYRDSNGKKRQPQWKNGNSGTYNPSYNIGPHTCTPILASTKQLGLDADEYGERVLCPMRWGLIPPWSKDGGKGFNTINCRIETINEKVTFKQPLNKGRRCVVVADGFFEWHTKDGKKQPYFIYFKDDVKQEFDAVEKHDTPNQQLLTIAGLYEESKSPEKGDEDSVNKSTPFTYTVITVPSSEKMKWLHERMPAILENEDEVRQWLDSGDIPAAKALSMLKPKDCLQWYPVSTTVNNIRNKSIECVQKIDLDTKKDIKPKGMMDFWVKKSPRKKHTSPTSSQEDVKIKTQDPLMKQEFIDNATPESTESDAKRLKLSQELP